GGAGSAMVAHITAESDPPRRKTYDPNPAPNSRSPSGRGTVRNQTVTIQTAPGATAPTFVRHSFAPPQKSPTAPASARISPPGNQALCTRAPAAAVGAA